MPQSLARLYIHLVFSTKYRQPFLTDAIRESLHAYMAMVMDNLGCQALLINSIEDHIHILFELSRTIAVSQAVEKVKTVSSRWMKTQGDEWTGFTWQAGYGAFTVSASNVQMVRNYVENQREHHRLQSFQDEYRAFLDKHEVAYDERYIWD
ncbi:MAG TPA: IS200/IS605 family transposase [Candidatus Competibacteraceae bacterium]|nr:IS200/IS605 family transposase [Candidatus Competibacteraceae bacterium]HSA45326.1 IS200/IS605 family transposase [Candidatus Competibacteraceae bacterium]